MVFDTALGAANDKDHVATACWLGLFKWRIGLVLIHDWQHMFGTVISGRQEACTQTHNMKNRFLKGFRNHVQIVIHTPGLYRQLLSIGQIY